MINLIKVLFLALFFIISKNVHSFCDLEKINEESSTICELKQENKYVSMRFFEDGCEFPEGNKVSCLYSVSCVDERVYRGTSVYRQQNHSKSFCLTSNTINGENIKSLFDNPHGIYVLLNCDKYVKDKKNNVTIKIDNQSVDCNLDDMINKLAQSRYKEAH